MKCKCVDGLRLPKHVISYGAIQIISETLVGGVDKVSQILFLKNCFKFFVEQSFSYYLNSPKLDQQIDNKFHIIVSTYMSYE